MMRVAVLLFLLATSHVSTSITDEGSSGNSKGQCIEKEREALLSFKQGLVDPHNLLSSWTNSSRDCCTWLGIRCDNLTHHIIILILRPYNYSRILGGEIGPSLVELQHLRHLDLSGNNFTNIPKFIGALTRLRYLNLRYNPISGIIPSQLGNLTRLHFLDLCTYLGNAQIINLEWLSHLPSLKFLSLCGINLTKAIDWFQSFKTAPSLSSLELYGCQFPSVDISFLSHKNSSNSLTNLYIYNSTIHPMTVPWLLNLSSNLVNLSLSDSQIKGPIPNSFENMRSLARINLWGNEFDGRIPKSLGNLCNLRELYLGNNKFNTTLSDIFESLSGCAKDSLEILWLSSNQIGGPFPDISMMSYLRELHVSSNKLNGTISEGIGELHNLEILDIASNSLTGPFPDISMMSYLRELYAANNKLNGALPDGIGELHQLETLDFSSNSLTGVVSEVHFQKLSKLTGLGLSGNSLTMNFNPNWVPPFQLNRISLGSCKLGPQFPSWLQTQVNISDLDISNSGIQDAIPNWFCNQTSKLDNLNISSNQFHGPIPPCLLKVKLLYLSNNRFISLRSFLCEEVRGATEVLDISNNLLFGNLPDCWWSLKNLMVLNLDNNNFSGVIPSSIGLLNGIQFLFLGHNNFTGNLPSSLKNCTQLQVFDAEENNLEGKIPTWIGQRLTNLIFLRLKSNKFYGGIPSNICHLRFVQILDFSANNISGPIPPCLTNFTSMKEKKDHVDGVASIFDGSILAWVPVSESSSYGYEVQVLILWKGVYYLYKEILQLLRLIDLSSNKLNGQIPEDLTNLAELLQLNLSRNNLSGDIPVEVGKLTSLESLDLSHNKLSSKIPSSLADIYSLSYLDLSNNQLSGRIPTGTQLQTFDASRFIGNLGLCGSPLPNSCPEDEIVHGLHDDLGGDEWFEMKWFHMGIGAGFTVGFAGVCANLLLNTPWSLALSQFSTNLGDWLYVTICVKVAVLKRRFSS